VVSKELLRARHVLLLGYKEPAVLLIHHPTIWLVLAAWVVAANDPRTDAESLKCHHHPPAKASVILPGLVHIELLYEGSKQYETHTSLLALANVLVDIMGHDGPDLRLPPTEQLVEAIDVTPMSHAQLMFIVSNDINFEIIMNFLGPFNLVVVCKSVSNPIYVFVDEPNNAVGLF
jgi:hypothetical protein